MEATITQSFQAQTQTPLEAIFDSVTDALLSVNEEGVIRTCNRACTRYFGHTRKELVGSGIGIILPDLGDAPLHEYLSPFMSNFDDTKFDVAGGEVMAQRADGSRFHSSGSISKRQLKRDG